MSLEDVLKDLTAAIRENTAVTRELAGLRVNATHAPAVVDIGTTAEAPAKPRGRKPAVEKAEAPAAETPAPTVGPLADLVAPAPAPVAPAVTQQDVGKALLALGQAKGRAAVVAVLEAVGAKDVPSIPADKFGEVIAAAKKAAA